MKNIKVVIGANFGDEGKGLMVDYFCHQLHKTPNEPVLNVRYNGGAQAGHTVVTPSGRRHMFSHFGAGSFNKDIVTYLSPHFIVNPILFRREWNSLSRVGITPTVLLDETCRMTFPFDMLINQIVEKYRNKNRHGSCGVGIFETVRRCESLVPFLISDTKNPTSLADYYSLCVNIYIPKRLKELGVQQISVDDMDLLRNSIIFNNYMQDLNFMLSKVQIISAKVIRDYNSIVFEGAQGLLLDQTNMDYFPHLTPSSPGMRNVADILQRLYAPAELEVCYVTRPYFTRHGAGRFDTACSKDAINPKMIDLTNGYNEFQQDFRYGYFDSNEFQKALTKDSQFIKVLNPKVYNITKSVALTHCDDTKGGVVIASGEYDIGYCLADDITKTYTSDGPTRFHVSN